MKKLLLVWLIFTVTCQIVLSQNRFELNIRIDSSVNKSKLSFSYFDGNNDVLVKDTFINHNLKIDGKFFSEQVPFTVTYQENTDNDFKRTFFVNKITSQLDIYLQKESSDAPLSFSCKNLLLVDDTASNKTFKQLFNQRIPAAKLITNIIQQHSDSLFTNDSLQNIYKTYFKELNKVTMSFLGKHSSEYFSLWYFRTQVVRSSLGILQKDALYLNSLIAYFKNTFPIKYQHSIEGENIVKSIEAIIAPPGVNILAPLFTKADLNSRKISLSEFKGKYVLLDFWASWCPPCMASVPFLNSLRKEYSTDKLVMIGVSHDLDEKTLRKTIAAKDMRWIHLFDEGDAIASIYGVNIIPSFFLINTYGKIIFRGTGLEDKEKLTELLQKLLPQKY